MSYVSNRNDIKEKWDEFWRASERLGEVLKCAELNSTFTQRQVLQCRYLEAQLKADRHKIWEDINDVLEGEDDN